MKKIMLMLLVLIGLFIACDNESRYARPLLDMATNFNCPANAMRCNNGAVEVCLNDWTVVSLCPLVGQSCTTDNIICGGEVDKSACCK